MRGSYIFAFLLAYIIVLCSSSVTEVKANPYLDPDVDMSYQENYLDDILSQPNTAEKRSCIPRGGNCDNHLNACCYNSACRCNLWGSNCRCQRMGLFQKWG